MAEIRSQDKRDKLRLIFAQCKPTGQSLQTSLLAALAVCDAAINGGATPGTWLSSTQEAGGGVSFQALHEYTPIIAKRMIGEMCDAFDKAVEDIDRFNECQKPPLAAILTTGTNDAQIYSHMLKHSFRSIRKFRSDFTGGRYGVGIFGATS